MLQLKIHASLTLNNTNRMRDFRKKKIDTESNKKGENHEKREIVKGARMLC
jgi:hypothetical protein